MSETINERERLDDLYRAIGCTTRPSEALTQLLDDPEKRHRLSVWTVYGLHREVIRQRAQREDLIARGLGACLLMVLAFAIVLLIVTGDVVSFSVYAAAVLAASWPIERRGYRIERERKAALDRIAAAESEFERQFALPADEVEQ